jgi:hypothetical protein
MPAPPRRRVRLLGLIHQVRVAGDPATLRLTLEATLTDENIDNVLLLADLKRHGGPVELELAQLQLPLPLAPPATQEAH